jgi:hypothetical protein
MSLRNTVLTVIVGLSCACAAARADEPSNAAADSPDDAQVLLFKSGRTIEGQIDETETHYVVTRATGKVEIPKAEIEFVADDLDDVYRYKLERINDAKPDDHFRLAQWCLLVNLRERAAEELERCLVVDPNSARAKGLLENLRRAPKPAGKSNPPRAEPEPSRSKSPEPAKSYPSFQKELSPSQVSTFSVQVQPLLVRTCGTAGCHDANHPGPLTLLGTFRPNQRSSQQNLRAVLSLIDTEEPDLSPLLVESLRPHGTANRSPFGKELADPAYAKLSDWVRAVSGKPTSKAAPIIQTDEPTAARPDSAQPSSKPTETEAAPSNRVYSNKPIPQTPARSRAGMTPANAPTDATSSRPPTKKDDAPGDAPPDTVENTSRVSASSPQSDSKSSKSDSAPAPSDSQTDAKPATKSGARPAASVRTPVENYQPIDPFDPEIFNRQFAPR